MNETKHHTLRGVLCTTLGGVCWGFSGTCGQYLFSHYHISSLWLTCLRLLVGGRGRKGNFQLVMLASTEDYAPQTQPARDGAYLIEGACSHTEVAPYLEQYVKPEAARWHTLDDIAKTLDGCIAKLAEADQTVNTKYFRELVM